MPADPPCRPASPPPVSLFGPPADDLALEAAKEWLLALIGARPLASASDVPVADLVREGPNLCRAVLDALGSDAELERLIATQDGAALVARVVGACAGAEGDAAGRAAGAVEAIESLRVALLGVLSRSRGGSDPAAALAVADRLAHVCARLAAIALRRGDPTGDAVRTERDRPGDAPSPGAQPFPRPSLGEPSLGGRASELDDMDPLTHLAEASSSRAAGGPLAEVGERPLSVRRGDGLGAARPLWIAALERELAEGGRSGRPFVLALIDVDGADRLSLSQLGQATDAGLGAVGRAIRQHVRRADLLAHEDDGRIWVIAPDAGRSGGLSLAARLARAVERAGSARGAPLRASIGVAVFPQDGRDPLALTDQAEERMFAARAAGVAVADADYEEHLPTEA